MKIFKSIVWIVMAVAVAGCGMHRRSPVEKQYFLLDVQRPEAPAQPKPAVCMRVRPCQVAAPFAGRSLVYRTSGVRYEQDYYNLFLTGPDEQITDAMRTWFRQFGFADCISTDKTTREKYTLEPRVDLLCADFTENPAAVVQMHVLVTRFDASCSCVKTVLEKTFTARTPLPAKPTAVQVVEGLSVSLSQIFQELENDSENTFRERKK